MLPWMLWLAERTLRRGGLGPAIGLAVVTGIAVAGGHPGAQLHVLAATCVYVALRAALLPEVSGAVRLRRLALAGGGVAAGILLVAVMFLPELLSAHGTLGTVARAQGGQPGTSMPLTVAHSILFPDWWGRPSSLSTYVQPISHGGAGSGAVAEANYNERTIFAGVVALLLACIALAAPGGWRRKAPFALLAGLALAISLHAPVLSGLVAALPGFHVVQNQRAHVVFELGVAVLAAFGLQGLLERPRGEARRRLGILALALALGAFAIVTLAPSGQAIGDVLKHFATRSGVGSDIALRLTTMAWYLLFAAGVTLAVLALRRWPRRATAIGLALVALTAFDMLRFAEGYQPMGPASKVIPPTTPAIAYLQRHAAGTRFLGLGTALTNDWSMMYGLDDVRGYDPPFPTLRFFRLWQTANPAQTNWQSLRIDGLSPEALRVASVLGAGYVIGGPGLARPGGGSGVLHAVRRVYAGDDATIFRNELAAPRVLVPERVEVVDDEAQARAAIVAEGFDPRRMAVVERGELGAADAAALAAAPVHGTVAIAGEQDARVTLDASLDRRGVVALNDSLTDGWSVTVDGHPATPLHLNDAMRGVVVPAGRHRIVWTYCVPGLRVGAGVGLLTVLALGGGAVVLLVRRRRLVAERQPCGRAAGSRQAATDRTVGT